MPRTLSPAVFRKEADRRLIETWDLMNALGLRSKEGVWARVKAGTLPKPVYTSPYNIALWDLDDIEMPDNDGLVVGHWRHDRDGHKRWVKPHTRTKPDSKEAVS